MATNHGPLLRVELRINKTHMKHYIQVLLRRCPTPCLHSYGPGYVNLHTTPLQSRKQNLVSKRRWSKVRAEACLLLALGPELSYSRPSLGGLHLRQLSLALASPSWFKPLKSLQTLGSRSHRLQAEGRRTGHSHPSTLDCRGCARSQPETSSCVRHMCKVEVCGGRGTRHKHSETNGQRTGKEDLQTHGAMWDLSQ